MSQCDLAADEPAAYLFKVVVGPTYKPEEFEPLLRLLSRRFSGELWSYGSYEIDITYGRMRLRVVKDRSAIGIVNFIRFVRAVLQRARELQPSPLRGLVVTSYDPFKGGLLAWRVARMLDGMFVCEVNGDYGDPDNFADIKSVSWRSLRLLQMRILGAFVLRRANAVRLLFADQLKNFVTPRPGTIVRQFFALSFTDRFRRGPEEPFILSAGFPFRRKGVDILVSAFLRIAPDHPDWKLVLVGHRLPDELRALDMQHPQIVTFPGMPQEALAEWMSRCAIFALASRSEAMGRVLIEAAAAGKCRIATRVGGIPTVVEHGRDGILVKKESVDELATGLETLITDEVLRERLGCAARRRVEHEFSGSAYLSRFEELISATLRASEAVTHTSF
jgi:glycosyltransferase involved in cell wall biosynthesis